MHLSPLIRSVLFVPASRPEFIPKADAAGADALIFDLEDSVSHNAKDAARVHLTETLKQRSNGLSFIRINHPQVGQLDPDLAVIAPHSGQSIIIPKCEHPDDVIVVDRKLSEFERRHHLLADSVTVVVVAESSLGLRNLYDLIRAAPRVKGAALASAEEGDLIVDLGAQWTPEGTALAYARGKFVCDARAARAQWLFDGAFMDLSSSEALQRESQIARICGFTGKMAIHPRQVAVINSVFSPSESDLARARRMIEAFRAAEARGQGAVKFEGMMVDYANVKRAQQMLALATG